MLERLMVRDLALIEKSDVEFGPGLNILTGETGAGKSILLGSIQLALGQKAGKDIIRHGKEQALVTLSFSLTGEEEEALRLLEDDLEIEEGTLLIKRKITEKKSETRVNDVPVTLSKLREMSGTLLDLHGQYEHYSLLKEGAYLSIVDAYLSGKGEGTSRRVQSSGGGTFKRTGFFKLCHFRTQGGFFEARGRRGAHERVYSLREYGSLEIFALTRARRFGRAGFP